MHAECIRCVERLKKNSFRVVTGHLLACLGKDPESRTHFDSLFGVKPQPATLAPGQLPLPVAPVAGSESEDTSLASVADTRKDVSALTISEETEESDSDNSAVRSQARGRGRRRRLLLC